MHEHNPDQAYFAALDHTPRRRMQFSMRAMLLLLAAIGFVIVWVRATKEWGASDLPPIKWTRPQVAIENRSRQEIRKLAFAVETLGPIGVHESVVISNIEPNATARRWLDFCDGDRYWVHGEFTNGDMISGSGWLLGRRHAAERIDIVINAAGDAHGQVRRRDR